MKKIFSLFAAVLFAGSMMAGTVQLTNANIVAAGDATSGYQDWTVKDDANRDWKAYAIKNKHSNATSQYHFLQIKKYASETASYIQIPELEETILSITMTVSNASKPMDGGSNTATLFFSASNSTSAAGEGVVSGTGASSVTIDATELNLKKGYITSGGAVRIWDITITTGTVTPPAVATPVIAGETSFFDETEVSITCETEGAKIYYTIDGAEPSATSTEYTGAFKLNASATVKAIAIKGEDKSTVVEKEFVKAPSYNSIEDLVASSLASGKAMRVSFTAVEIDSVYTIKAGNRRGIYVHVLAGEKDVEIYYGKDDVPAEWKVGGTVSGTITGTWTLFNSNQWEIVPAGDSWKWTELTYMAPREVVTAVSFTGFEGFFKVGMTWNSSARSDLWLGIQPGEGTGYWWEQHMQNLYKWNEATEKYELVSADLPGTVLTAGKYMLEVQLRIEGTDAQTKRLPKEGETPNLTITVDGVNWPYTNGATVEDTYSFDWIKSPAFELVDDPTGVEDVMNGKVSTKVLRDGVLIIERDGVRYNVLGEIVR